MTLFMTPMFYTDYETDEAVAFDCDEMEIGDTDGSAMKDNLETKGLQLAQKNPDFVKRLVELTQEVVDKNIL